MHRRSIVEHRFWKSILMGQIQKNLATNSSHHLFRRRHLHRQSKSGSNRAIVEPCIIHGSVAPYQDCRSSTAASITVGNG
ncbi:hypothetical protein ACLOJK_026737 [Asimina triloba]